MFGTFNYPKLKAYDLPKPANQILDEDEDEDVESSDGSDTIEPITEEEIEAVEEITDVNETTDKETPIEEKEVSADENKPVSIYFSRLNQIVMLRNLKTGQ